MNRFVGKLRNLEIASYVLEKEDVIDTTVTFNNVAGQMPITAQGITTVYPPDYPYIGLRGRVDQIIRYLTDSPSEFTTVDLAPILGIEPLKMTPGDFQNTSILKQPQRFKGKGTLIGIIDTGIDYTHPCFINDKGETRIQAIWDQSIGRESLYGYGTVYDRETINQALQNPDPFSILPHRDEWGEGTMLAGIGAGFMTHAKGTYRGVAPEAELIIVKLRPAPAALQKIFYTSYNPLGFSALDVALAVQYICNQAAILEKPLSICFPIGGNTGPHDGSEALSKIMGSYAINKGISIVLGAGDEGNKSHHASGILKENEFQQVKLVIPQGQEGFLVEIWASFGDRIEVSLVPPQADPMPMAPIPIIVLNEPQDYKIGLNSSVWTQGSKIDPETGCQLIKFRLDKPMPGDWTISIRGLTIIKGTYNIWIPKAGMILPGTVLSPSSPFVTLSNASTVEEVITVGCYDSVSSGPCASTGRGLTRDDRVKPDFLVEGVNIPGPLPAGQFGYITGTAPSCAITAGICALIYEKQIDEKTNYFNTPMMKAMLVQRLTRYQTLTYPSSSRGYGLLDINDFSYQ